MNITAPRGTKDILPAQSVYWHYIENKIRETCRLFNYQEIRTPIFEQTELFLRGIGETTDVVEKEMYTFTDRGKRSLTLRPENTASVVRAYLENKMYADKRLSKLYYVGAMFRYDRPQAGRQRQFHQFGIECIGAENPAADAEVIFLAQHFFHSLGLDDLEVSINSVGCPQCRPGYREKLKDFFAASVERLCADCRSRFERNPLRILDCKNKECAEIAVGVPTITEHLCTECSEHFDTLCGILDKSGISYSIDPQLVRGLDYYTKTAFEIKSTKLGAQSAICGGGRYDGLIAECGGPKTPAIGFAVGMERVLLMLEQADLLPKDDKQANSVFVVALGKEAQQYSIDLMQKLRNQGIGCDAEWYAGAESMKSQMKAANRSGASIALIIGEEELKEKGAVLKVMQTGEQEFCPESELAEIIKGKLA